MGLFNELQERIKELEGLIEMGPNLDDYDALKERAEALEAEQNRLKKVFEHIAIAGEYIGGTACGELAKDALTKIEVVE